ncbi:MAG: hypothetical protein ACR2PS_14410 [Pseudomonadales bacterium]
MTIPMTTAEEEAALDAALERQAREFYAEPKRVYPSVEELQEQWDAMSSEEQMGASDRFQWECVSGADAADNYWYDLLMPETLKYYVGD